MDIPLVRGDQPNGFVFSCVFLFPRLFTYARLATLAGMYATLLLLYNAV